MPMIFRSLYRDVNHILTDSVHMAMSPQRWAEVILSRNHSEVIVSGQHTGQRGPVEGGRGASQVTGLHQHRAMNQHVNACILTLLISFTFKVKLIYWHCEHTLSLESILYFHLISQLRLKDNLSQNWVNYSLCLHQIPFWHTDRGGLTYPL